ncbi:hypothetical protein [Bombiscardovia coagulans]|nr:hypothetical protein [Bombiscardovia coagulans]
MDILTDNISPYWLADPLIAQANRKTVTRMVYGNQQVPLSYITGLPSCPLPVLTVEGATPEHNMFNGLYALPFIYLPEEIWLRRPGELLAVYHMRIIIALDMLNLLTVEDGLWFTPIPEAPNTPEQVNRFTRCYTRQHTSNEFNTIRNRIAEQMTQTWPEGYSFEQEWQFADSLADLSMRGSAVLMAQRALALSMEGGQTAEYAVSLLREAQACYGAYFNPTSMDPHSVREWMTAHRDDAYNLFDQLVTVGLERQEVANTVREVLDD